MEGRQVLEYGRREPSWFDRTAWALERTLRGAASPLLPVLVVVGCGVIGGYLGYRLHPPPTFTFYWKVDLSPATRPPGEPALNKDFSPSEFFAPAAVGALRQAGLVNDQPGDAVIRRIFMFMRAPKPGRPMASIQLGFESPDAAVSRRAGEVLANEVGRVLTARGVDFTAYSTGSWAYDDHGGPTAATALGAILGTIAGLLLTGAYTEWHSRRRLLRSLEVVAVHHRHVRCRFHASANSRGAAPE
jgi:hypothetical protein